MKKLIISILVIVFSTSIAFADTTIPPLEDTIMRYNSVADTLGAKTIDIRTEIDQNGTKVYYAGSCLVTFILNEDGVLTNAGVYMLKSSDPIDFIMACMTVITYLGDMNYEAYGHLLHQYSGIITGQSKMIWIMPGFDRYEMSKTDSGELMFVYYNYDLKTWF